MAKILETVEKILFLKGFSSNVRHLWHFRWLILPPFGYEIRLCLAVLQASQKHIISRWKKELGKAVF